MLTTCLNKMCAPARIDLTQNAATFIAKYFAVVAFVELLCLSVQGCDFTCSQCKSLFMLW